MSLFSWLKSKFAGSRSKGNVNVAEKLKPDAGAEALTIAKQLAGQGVSVRDMRKGDKEMEVGEEPL